METIIQKIIVLVDHVVHGAAVLEVGHQDVPGRLHNLHHHVVGQVLDQGQHFLAQPEGRMVDFELMTFKIFYIYVNLCY